jgi:cytoskeletal protein RodZ
MNTRRLGLFSAWVAGTILAVVLASQAVGLVRDQVTDRPSRAVTTLRTIPDAVSPTTSDVPNDDGPLTTSTTTHEEVPTTQPETVTTTAASTGSTSAQRYSLTGGWVTVACEGDQIVFRSAAPQAGYQVERVKVGSSEVEVEFRGSDHTSRFQAECEHGSVVESIDEGDHDD